MTIIRLPQAITDLVETATYIAEDSPDAADRFFDAFEATLEALAQNPKIGSIRRYRDSVDVRM